MIEDKISDEELEVQLEEDDDDKPILNWECFSDSDLNDIDWFVNSDYPIPRRIASKMQDVVDEHAESTNIKLSKFYRKSLVMAGGEYTYLFILPRVMRWLQIKMPRLEITIKMHDVASTRGLEELKHSDCDIVFGGYHEGDESKWEGWKSAGFFRDKRKFADHIYPSVHKGLVDLYGDAESTIKDVDLIFGRCNVEYDEANMIRLYPMPRKGNDIRILADTYILAYICMVGGLGMWIVFRSMPEQEIEKLVKLTSDHTTTMYRMAFYKRKKRPWVYMAINRFFYLLERPAQNH